MPIDSPKAACYCAMGAIITAAPAQGLRLAGIKGITTMTRAEIADWERTFAVKALEAVLPKGFDSIAHYNDDPRCKFRHVRALFGKAILKLEGRL